METNDFNDDLNINTVQSYEEACQLLGIKPTYPKFVQCTKIDRPSMIAYYKLIIIIRALNLLPNGKCWVPNFNDPHQYRYRICWDIVNNNLGSAYAAITPSYTTATFGGKRLVKVTIYIGGNLIMGMIYVKVVVVNQGFYFLIG